MAAPGLLSPFGRSGGFGDSGVDQRGCHRAGCFCGAGIVVHPRRDAGPVVEQHELLGELFWVTSPSLFGKIEEQRPKPVTILLGNFRDAAALGCLGAGADESAPPETWLGKRQTLYVEYPEQPLTRSCVPRGKLGGHAFARPIVASHEIRPHEPILVPEDGV